MKNTLQPLAKNVLLPLGITAAATDAAIQKKIYGFNKTALRISNEETKDILELVKHLEESGLLVKDVSKSIENEAKEQKGGFLPLLLGTLGANLLQNMLPYKAVIQAGEGTIRSEQDF